MFKPAPPDYPRRHYCTICSYDFPTWVLYLWHVDVTRHKYDMQCCHNAERIALLERDAMGFNVEHYLDPRLMLALRKTFRNNEIEWGNIANNTKEPVCYDLIDPYCVPLLSETARVGDDVRRGHKQKMNKYLVKGKDDTWAGFGQIVREFHYKPWGGSRVFNETHGLSDILTAQWLLPYHRWPAGLKTMLEKHEDEDTPKRNPRKRKATKRKPKEDESNGTKKGKGQTE